MNDNAPEKPKIVSLHGHTIPPGSEPPTCMTDICEELLDMARRGEMIGIAVVWQDGGNAISTQYHTHGHPSMIVGGMEHLKHRILTRC